MSKPVDIKVKLGTLTLKSPIVCASGTFGYGLEMKGLTDFSRLGAFITKTITGEPRVGNLPPRIIEVETGVLNSIGLENPGVDIFIQDYVPHIKKIPCECIVSIGGHTFEEYKEVLKKLESVKGIRAYEINLSCPNLQLKRMISQDPHATYKVVKTLRAKTARPLIVKVTGETEDIAKIVGAAKSGGADAVSLVNTFFGMAIDIVRQKPYLGKGYGGYSGKGIKPLSVYRVWNAAQAVDIPLIGGGGVMNAADAIEFFLAGAHVVSIGTLNFLYPNACADITGGIIAYMRAHKIKKINELTGRAHE
ncbi:MAG: dihydroorotate dehydrogenase [Candidatus Omnitrophica bacterium]|nr:dihydroorotate dehydrogenase [Candidatus Omnitrophota bacterium]